MTYNSPGEKLQTRYVIEMSESTAEEFEELAQDCGVSYAELIRKALQTLKALHDQQKNGRKVVIRSEQGDEQELIALG